MKELAELRKLIEETKALIIKYPEDLALQLQLTSYKHREVELSNKMAGALDEKEIEHLGKKDDVSYKQVKIEANDYRGYYSEL